MSPTQKRRLTTVALLLVGITVTTFLALKAMNSSIEYFLTPSEVQTEVINPAQQ